MPIAGQVTAQTVAGQPPAASAPATAPTPASAAAPTPAAAPATVFRCEAQGRVLFQQVPCPPGQRASAVAVPPINVVPGTALRAASAPAPVASAASAAPPTVVARPAGSASEPLLPPESTACLAYLQPLLRDPASGRIVSAERDGRILRVKLQASDARGRPQQRDAACEFVNGRVDDAWSRIQLKRLGWFAPRVLVQGNDREARRAARALEESIEAEPKR